MNATLVPHPFAYFGQDFTTNHLIEKLDLQPIRLKEGRYNFYGIDASQIRLLITRYPDLRADVDLVRKYCDKYRIASHVHLRYSFMSAIQRKNLYNTLACSHLHITNSKDLVAEYEFLFPKYKWQYVNNGIDSKIYYSTTLMERLQFRRKFEIPNDKILICFVGRLSAAKGVQLLDKICSFVSSSKNYFLLIQYIDLPKYKDIAAAIIGKYKNIRIVIDQSIRAVRYSDVHVSTSLAETTSLVTLEALFSGVPVICTNVTSFYREIEDWPIGFNYFNKIEIPNRFISDENAKQGIFLNENEVMKISSNFIECIQKIEPLSEMYRLKLSKRFSDSDFEIAHMVKSLRSVYG